jgi:hypothetical protein
MKFDKGIGKKYRESVENAFTTIIAKGNEFHRHMMNEIIRSDLLIRVQPVKAINASPESSTPLRLATKFGPSD